MRTLALGLLAATALLTASPAQATTFKGRIGTFVLTYDPRDCVTPLCGGFWVDAANHQDQRCADGTISTTCYVADVDYQTLGWTQQDWIDYLAAAGPNTIVVKGKMTLKDYPGFGQLGVMTLSKAWVQWLPPAKP